MSEAVSLREAYVANEANENALININIYKLINYAVLRLSSHAGISLFQVETLLQVEFPIWKLGRASQISSSEAEYYGISNIRQFIIQHFY